MNPSFRFEIGLDVRMLQSTGIGTYLQGLLEGARARRLLDRFPVCLFGRNDAIAGIESVYKHSFNAPIYSLQEQIDYFSLTANCRLWHAPHYNVPIRKGKSRLVVTIHDIIHWIFRKQFLSPLQTFYAGQMLRRALALSDAVIAVSQHTKRDLIHHFAADPAKITVIPEGVHPHLKRADEGLIERVKTRYGITGSYFLYVGMLKPHKNILWLYDLFRKMKDEGRIRSSLVIVGPKSKRNPEGYERLSEIESGHGIIYLPQVPYEELSALYSGAVALAHPSLYEGFGLTLLEAMACRTPVIALKTSSIPEVTGDSAYLVEPHAAEQMQEALLRLEQDEALRRELCAKGLERARQFRWEDAAQKTFEIYEKVLA